MRNPARVGLLGITVGLVFSFFTHTFCFGQDAPKPANWTEQPVSDELVREAIKRGIDYLFKFQDQSPNSNWETIKQSEYEAAAKKPADNMGPNSITGQYSAPTSLVLMALLKNGLRPDNPHFQKAVKFVMSVRPTQTYGNGLRSALLGTVNRKTQNEYKKEIDYEKQWLLEALFASGTYKYNPPANDPERMKDAGDYSNTQYGVLGMWLLSDIPGMEITERFWEVLQNGYLKNQRPDGGWPYVPGGPSSQSMTLGALASLHVIWDKRFTATCEMSAPKELRDAIDKGFDWLGRNYDPAGNPGGPEYGAGLYTLYGTERVAVASGPKYFGKNNWWELGAKYALFTQQPEGNWPASDQEGANVKTAWALLFLAYGHAPVIINKLNYSGGSDQQWNSRPRDLARLTHWLDVGYQKLYNWQYVSIDRSVEELLDAPVLFMSGKVGFKLKDAEKAKLREYVLAGGLLFGEAIDGSKNFADSYRALAKELFPELEMSPLPPEHPIYTIKWADELAEGKVPPLEGVRNGLRVMMLLSPKDLSCAWQTWQIASHAKSFYLADNITLEYVGNQENALIGRGSSYMIRDLGYKPATSVTVGRLAWEGNSFSWDPEPAAWTRLDV